MEIGNFGSCTLAVGSMNRAIQAKNYLSGAKIFSRVVKVDAESSHRGCTYGVALSCADGKSALDFLKKAGIRSSLISHGR